MTKASRPRPIAAVFFLSLAFWSANIVYAADSASYTPIDVPWQKPSAATADNAAYATNAGSATSATTAATANALCPSCDISGSQVSGTVANATNAENSNYSNSAGYANNAGYAYSAAASTGASCPSKYEVVSNLTLPAANNGSTVGNLEQGDSHEYICVVGTWVDIYEYGAPAAQN